MPYERLVKYLYIIDTGTKNSSICHLAKEKKKLPFLYKFSHVWKVFNLIHVNFWGPCSISYLHDHRYFIIVVDDYSL